MDIKKIYHQKSQRKSAFSLIELSIVILIVSILITGSIGVSKTVLSSSKNKISKERMEVVYKSIGNFVASNRRLPCPASLAVAKGSSTYGDESATPGTCTGAFKSSTNAPNLAYGMVPIKALGLDPEMAEDGFGNKFSYVVDMRFTKASVDTTSNDGFEITKSLPNETDSLPLDLGGIIPQGPAGTNLLSNQNGILLLISHGANKFKGFNAAGTAQTITAGVADENDNGCDENAACNTSGTTSFDREFVVNSTSSNFDDLVLFKNKNQLATDAGLEFLMCNGNEANTAAGNTVCPSQTWTTPLLKNASYGSLGYSNSLTCVRTCGKYGIWGAPSAVLSSSNITVTKSFDYAGGGMPVSGALFTYRGGTLLVIASVSGYQASGSTITANLFVRNSADTTNILSLGPITQVAATVANAHTSLNSRYFVVDPGSLTTGTNYRMRLEAAAGNFDGNDRYDVAVIEFPPVF